LLGEGDGDVLGLGEGFGVGLAKLLERALLVVLTPGVTIGPGPWLAKYRASGTTIMPAITVRTKVTAPHSRRSTDQFTSR
jgi:hypothetical protein